MESHTPELLLPFLTVATAVVKVMPTVYASSRIDACIVLTLMGVTLFCIAWSQVSWLTLGQQMW